ncbi:MAG TPA: nucleotidyltransferase family protein [Terriglobia bacterium]|nr:nucleotidyltransferase family protein [Terriglobia bacterium]
MPSVPDALILCGGAGLRLRSVTGTAPKAMADVAGRPFLELLLRQLSRHGFRHTILAVGYQKEMIRSRFRDRILGLSLEYSAETQPLGTGGALRRAADLVQTENLLVMNGDSYTDADLNRLVTVHRQAAADVSIVVVPADGRIDCGSVLLDGNGSIGSFSEKAASCKTPFVNAGIYVMSRSLLYEIPPGVEVSLERELLPRWLQNGKTIKGFICSGRCTDIGTPERYRLAQELLASAETDTHEVGGEIRP